MIVRPGRLMTRLLIGAGVRTELYSLRSVDECRQRLNASTDSPWMPFGSKTYAMVSLKAEKTGTRITCRFCMHPIVTAFMAIWFAGVVLIGGPITVSIIAAILGSAGQTSGSLPPIAAVIAPAMLAFGCALVGFGQWLARDEATFLKNFFLRTLDATEVMESNR